MPSAQRGFSIIEILVTTAIAAIALAGLAQLQLNSIKINHGALLASYAAMHARDLSERMLANQLGAASLAGIGTVIAHYNIELLGLNSTALAAAKPVAVAACEIKSVTACAPAQRAQTDYANWLTMISNDMPPGTEAQVCQNSAEVAYSLNNIPACSSSSTIRYTPSVEYVQNSFPITYYITIKYPFRGTTLGVIAPVEMDAYSQVNQ